MEDLFLERWEFGIDGRQQLDWAPVMFMCSSKYFSSAFVKDNIVYEGQILRVTFMFLE